MKGKRYKQNKTKIKHRLITRLICLLVLVPIFILSVSKILTWLNEKAEYKVFSVYQIENEDYYITTRFNNKEYESFLKTIKSRSNKDFGVDVTAKDKILTLSSCANNNKYRVVLHAKKLSKTN